MLKWNLGGFGGGIRVMTETGSRSLTPEIEGLLALCYNPKHLYYYWQEIDGVVWQEYEGQMYNVSSDDTSMLLSPNQRFFYGGGSKKKNGFVYNLQYEEEIDVITVPKPMTMLEDTSRKYTEGNMSAVSPACFEEVMYEGYIWNVDVFGGCIVIENDGKYSVTGSAVFYEQLQ